MHIQMQYIYCCLPVDSDCYLRMDASMMQGNLEVNFQNQDDEEAEFEREELQRQNEVDSAVVSCW